MRKKLLVGLAVSVAAAVIFSVGVLAGTTLEKITAYKDFSIVTKVDNLDKKFVSGKSTLSPILYNNKYYVPVEEFCQLNKLPVNFDSKKKIYYFGKKDGKVALCDIPDKFFYYTAKIVKDKSLLVSNGKAGDFGLQIDNITSATNTTSFTLNNKYTTLTFSAVPVTGDRVVKWSILNDKEEVLKTFNVTSDESKLSEMTVDVRGVNSLYITASEPSGGSCESAILKDLYLTTK